jgi:hypothetical protein
MKFDAFTAGGSFTLASVSAASELAMNYYADPIQGVANAEKGPMALVRTPGISLFTTLPQGPTRGLWPGQNRLFAAGGSHLYEVLANGMTVDNGYIGNDGLPVQILSNGSQLYIVSDGLAWIDAGVSEAGGAGPPPPPSGAVPIFQSILLFDLSIDAGTGGLTGATGGIFDSTDVGETICITSGVGFTVQCQIVTSVVNGQAFGASGWGTGGSTGGEGIEWLYVEGQLAANQGAFLDGYFFASAYNSNKVYFSAIDDGTMWNPLDYFIKASYPDNVAALAGDHQELYVFGDLESSQVFQDTGDANSPFQPNPGAIMHFGCVAPFSVTRLGQGLAWLGGDVRRGDRFAFLAVGFQPEKISTAAEEIAWGAYSTIEDAISYSEIYNGHEFWVVHFPSGNATWAYDLTTGIWAQRGWWTGAFDANGFPVWARQRQSFHAVVSLGNTLTEKHYVGDWQNGQIYIQSAAYLTDNGTTIYRQRSCPHLTQENLRTFYHRFEIDCDVTGLMRVFWNLLGYGRDRIWSVVAWQPTGQGVSLQLWFSDTRAQTWQSKPAQTLASTVDVTLANCYLMLTPGSS